MASSDMGTRPDRRQCMTGGQAIVRALRAEGVEVVFGIPGTHILSIYDALLDEPGIRRILPRHEQGAAFMADGYARATGRPGVVIITGGPGLSNAATGISEAYSDSSPILVISSQVRSDHAGTERGHLHEMKDQQGFMRSITGWHASVRQVAEIPTVIHEAMRRLKEGRPRPVHIEVPLDVLDAAADVALMAAEEYPRPEAELPAVAEAVELLRASERPLFYAGGGIATSGAEAELAQLAELLEAPVLMSVMGQGALPADHPLALLGARGHCEPMRELIEASDLALAVGTKFGAMATGSWTEPIPGNLIHIDIDPSVIGRSYPVRLGLVGDAKRVLGQLLDGLRSDPGQRISRAGQVREAVGAQSDDGWNNVPWQMGILSDLRRTLSRDAIVSCDMTLVGYASTRYLRVYATRTYLYPWTSGTLGFGLPAAIGAKIGCPDRQVVSLSGDGGFLFTGQELVAAVQHGIGIVAIVFNDHCYSAVKNMQRTRYGGRFVDVDLSRVDYCALAKAYGAKAMCVEPAKLADALKVALANPGPVLVEVPVAFGRSW